MPAEWVLQAKQCAAIGDRKAELQVLLAAGRAGSLEAAATYSRKASGHLPEEHCVAILEEVERRVQPDDWATHFALHLAYLIGVGSGARDFEELMRRSFEHLKQAARASDDASMYLQVGLHYWHGLNLVSPNPEQAARWLEAAASSGDPDMVRELKRFRRSSLCRSQENAA